VEQAQARVVKLLVLTPGPGVRNTHLAAPPLYSWNLLWPLTGCTLVQGSLYIPHFSFVIIPGCWPWRSEALMIFHQTVMFHTLLLTLLLYCVSFIPGRQRWSQRH